MDTFIVKLESAEPTLHDQSHLFPPCMHFKNKNKETFAHLTRWKVGENAILSPIFLAWKEALFSDEQYIVQPLTPVYVVALVEISIPIAWLPTLVWGVGTTSS